MKRTSITGCNRGIGLALTRRYLQDGHEVHAMCRNASPALSALAAEHPALTVHPGVDVRDAKSLDAASAATPGPIDVLICNAGILRADAIESWDAEALRTQFEVNSIGPLETVRAMRSRLQNGSKIGLITSMMGSMTDNGSGGYYGYRMSKAALNAAGVSLARDLAPEGIAVAILHPGYVRTDMTGGNGALDPEASADGLVARLDDLTLDDSGGFWHTNGSRIPW